MSVGILLVSHSVLLADGAAEVAREMAPDVAVGCAAGDADGGLGTSLERVQESLEVLLASEDAVVVLADLGSAVLTVESALELAEELAPRVRLASAPFVEGAVAAAVAAQQGDGLQAVLAAAEAAGEPYAPPAAPDTLEVPGAPQAPGVGGDDADAPAVTRQVVVRNPLGLHARPAAVVARTAASFGVPVTVQGVDATSVLQLMSLASTAGTTLEVAARGDRAVDAVDAVVRLVEEGFGEV